MGGVFYTSVLAFLVSFFVLECSGAYRSSLANRSRRLISCKKNEFMCGDKKCIPLSAVCNGSNDCTDGSDESVNQCTIVKLGACTSPSQVKICDLTAEYVGEENVTHAYLCRSEMVYKRNSLSLACTHGVWTPATASCKRMCRNISLTVSNVECYLNGQEQDCNKPLLSGTKIIPFCQNKGYKPNHDIVTCDENGEWDHDMVQCIPECGQSTKYGNEISNTTRPAQFREFPWVVAIYYDMENESQPIMFPGILISPFLVIARSNDCRGRITLVDSSKPNSFKVVAGKKTTYHSVVDDDLQRSYKVKAIHLSAQSSDELAIFELAEKINNNAAVQPVCVNWENNKSLNPEDGTPGQVPHWISTKNPPFYDRISHEVLHTLTMYLQDGTTGKNLFRVAPMPEVPMECGYGFIYHDAVTKLNYVQGIAVATDSTDTAPMIFKDFKDIRANITWINAIRKKTEKYLHQNIVLNAHPSKDVTEICKSDILQTGQTVYPGNEPKYLANGCELPKKDLLYLKYDVHCLPLSNQKDCENVKQDGLVPEFTSLTFNCTEGYWSTSRKEAVCFRNNWIPPIEPCRKICKKVQQENVNWKCFWQGVETDCDSELKSGSTAIVECAPGYHSITDLPVLKCNNDGQWSGSADVACIPDDDKLPIDDYYEDY